MRKLDEWGRSTAPPGAGGDPPTVSCIYLIYDAWSRELTFSNAGHDAPLMASGGIVRPLEVRHKGVLLGVRGRGIRGLPTYREQTLTLAPRHLPRPVHGRPHRPAYPVRRRRTLHRGRGDDRDVRRAAGRAGQRGRPRHRRRARCPGTSMTTWRSSCCAVRPMNLASVERSSPPSRLWSQRPGGSPRRRSPPGRWTPIRPISPACWSPRSSPTRCCTLGDAEPPGAGATSSGRARVGRGPAPGPRPHPAASRRRRRVPPGRPGPGSSRSGCGAERTRSGWRSSTPTCGCQDPQRPRDRRGRPGPVPGRAAGHPVGLAADRRWQGRLVRVPLDAKDEGRAAHTASRGMLVDGRVR